MFCWTLWDKALAKHGLARTSMRLIGPAKGMITANTIGILVKDVRAFIDALPDGPEPIHEAVD